MRSKDAFSQKVNSILIKKIHTQKIKEKRFDKDVLFLDRDATTEEVKKYLENNKGGMITIGIWRTGKIRFTKRKVII